MFDNVYVCFVPVKGPGADSISRCYIANMENPIVEIRRSHEVTGAGCTEVTAHWSRAEYTSTPQDQQRELSSDGIQCLIKKVIVCSFSISIPQTISI